MGRTQKVIADTISKELGIPQRIGRRFLERVIDLISDDIVYTSRIELRGLGVFIVTKRPPVKTKHPKTGKPITIPSKKIVQFRTSIQIRRRLNPKKPKLTIKKKPLRKQRKKAIRS